MRAVSNQTIDIYDITTVNCGELIYGDIVREIVLIIFLMDNYFQTTVGQATRRVIHRHLLAFMVVLQAHGMAVV